MLSKSICQKCIDENFYLSWDTKDDEHWSKHKYVWCIVLGVGIRIAEDPPVECPYYLEHMVMSDVE